VRGLSGRAFLPKKLFTVRAIYDILFHHGRPGRPRCARYIFDLWKIYQDLQFDWL